MSNNTSEGTLHPSVSKSNDMQTADVNKIMELPLEQLQFLARHSAEEKQQLKTQMQALLVAHDRFQGSRDVLENIDQKPTQILVPLTSAVYVPGKTKDVNKVLIDIGAGYHIEKSVAAGKEYYDKKKNMIMEQVQHLQNLINQKTNLQAMALEVMRIRES